MNLHDTESGLRSLPRAKDGVRIRTWRQEDVAAFEYWLQPHHDWHTWDAPYYPPLSAAEIAAAVNRVALAVRDHGGWVWPPTENGAGLAAPTGPVVRAVIADNDTDEMLGTVSWYWESQITAWARMGIQIFDPGERGAGRGATALELWADYLFEATTWQRLDYATWSGNAAMLRVGDKLGFVEEARFRNARVVNGEFYDSVVKAVLRSEWEQGRQSL